MRLNIGWSAEPNAPDERVVVDEGDVVLEFTLNHMIYRAFTEGQRGHIRFRSANAWRLGAPNDEGWHRGQCRFRDLAPAWGEFYGVTGDLKLDRAPSEWVGEPAVAPARHFLFYLRDSTFECQAISFEFLASAWHPLPNKA